MTERPRFDRNDLPRMELLRTFEAAARTASFTRAADEVSLTQSAVSRQIQQLESDLGVELFSRGHRSLVLTEAGKQLQGTVVDCLERLRDTTSRLRASLAPRQVAMTTTPGFASLWLIPRLARFTATHPQVDVRVSATLEVLDLARSRLDLAVRFRPLGDRGEPALFEEVVEPVCAPVLAQQGPHPLRRPQDLEHHTLLTVEPHSGEPATAAGLTTDWEPWFNIMRLPAPRMKNALRFTHYVDAVSAALAGHGVVIGRMPLLDELLREGRLVAPFSRGAASRRGYFVERAHHGVGNPDAREFEQWLWAEAQRMREARVDAD